MRRQEDAVPQGAAEPDKFLYDKGNESLAKHRWLTAREYFRRILDTYPQSNYGPMPSLASAIPLSWRGQHGIADSSR